MNSRGSILVDKDKLLGIFKKKGLTREEVSIQLGLSKNYFSARLSSSGDGRIGTSVVKLLDYEYGISPDMYELNDEPALNQTVNIDIDYDKLAQALAKALNFSDDLKNFDLMDLKKSIQAATYAGCRSALMEWTETPVKNKNENAKQGSQVVTKYRTA